MLCSLVTRVCSGTLQKQILLPGQCMSKIESPVCWAHRALLSCWSLSRCFSRTPAQLWLFSTRWCTRSVYCEIFCAAAFKFSVINKIKTFMKLKIPFCPPFFLFFQNSELAERIWIRRSRTVHLWLTPSTENVSSGRGFFQKARSRMKSRITGVLCIREKLY